MQNIPKKNGRKKIQAQFGIVHITKSIEIIEMDWIGPYDEKNKSKSVSPSINPVILPNIVGLYVILKKVSS